MRISDWSSDVCSSDLNLAGIGHAHVSEPSNRGGHRASLLRAGGQRRADDPVNVVGRLLDRCAEVVAPNAQRRDRKSGVVGKSVTVRVKLGGRRTLKKKSI